MHLVQLKYSIIRDITCTSVLDVNNDFLFRRSWVDRLVQGTLTRACKTLKIM